MDIEGIFHSAQEAFWLYKNSTAEAKSNFLKEIAKGLDFNREVIISSASQESNLPIARITGELGRTMGQIQLFVKLIEEGSWVEAVIDRADPERLPLPKPDIRRFLTPLGPVVVFGASNFPLAFSTAGGDTISALAAGCPVIYKGHPAHPKTSRLVADIISQAANETNMPKGVFTHVEGGIELGQALVKHPIAKAVAFTGSFTGGKAIFDLANQRAEPIPVFAEMGSINPIVTLPKRLSKDLKELAKQFVGSLTLGVGQFCTNPGLILVPKQFANEFAVEVKAILNDIAGAPMLHEGIAAAYYQSLEKLSTKRELEWHIQPKQSDLILGNPALAEVKAEDWLKEHKFQEEVFGCYALMVVYENQEELMAIGQALHGQLTITIWGEEEELVGHEKLLNVFKEKCGRLLFKGVPTGVEVGHAMQHGGPFPATTDSRGTSVGAYAIKRFARPIAFQDTPEILLPDALKSNNPLKIWRMVDGEFTKNQI
jgi:acyl-CoA reductase-like NAD-dependent aldehyde dehydrogenase